MARLHLTGGSNVDHIIEAPELATWPTAPSVYLPDHNVLYEAALDPATDWADIDLDDNDAQLLTVRTRLQVWIGSEQLCRTWVEFPEPSSQA